MTRYAAQTTVSSEKSRGEIEKILEKYGAEQFQYGWMGTRAVIAFVMPTGKGNKRAVKFELQLPDKSSREFTHTDTRGRERPKDKALEAWEQATRQRWRALLLVVKAKLEAVESGISTFEQEFFAFIVVPGTGNKTMGEVVAPQLEAAYRGESGSIKLLPG